MPDRTIWMQFAQMGSIYMENVVGIRKPRVAIVNNGAEEEKGNCLVKATFPLLKECRDINFIGSIEARDIPAGYADVVVCEAFGRKCYPQAVRRRGSYHDVYDQTGHDV